MKCIVCNKKFIKKKVWQKFCSRGCRYRYWDKKKFSYNKKYHKIRNLRRRYKMSIEQYEKLLRKQNGGCAICDINPQPPYRGLHVDHCHKENKIRGLLCSYCNRKIIGAIEKIGLNKIAKYLGYEISKICIKEII